MAIFLTAFSLGFDGEYFFNQRFGVILWLDMAMFVYFFKRYGFLASLTATYCLISATIAVYLRDNKYLLLGGRDVVLERAVSMGTWATLLIWIVVSQEIVSRKTFERLFVSFGIYQIIHFLFLKNFYAPNGFLMTPSVMSVYLALCIPLVWSQPFIVGVFAATIIATKGFTGISMLGAIGASWFVYSWRGRLAILASSSLALAAALKMGLFGLDKGRYLVWKTVYAWWQNQGFPIFGMGAGTAYSLVPWIQEDAKIDNGGYYYAFLHNEYLQALFELGWFGVGLILVLFAWSFARMYEQKRRSELAFLCALVPACFSQFPFRLEAVLILVAFQLHYIWKRG